MKSLLVIFYLGLLSPLYVLGSEEDNTVQVKNSFPKNQATVERNPWGFFEFWWTGPNKEGPYTLEISRSEDFQELLYFQTVKRNHEYTKHLADQGTYYWRVRYKDQTSSPHLLVTTKPKDLPISIEPLEIHPFNLKKRQQGYLLLKWKDPANFGPYDIQISTDPNFKKLVFSKRVKTSSFKVEDFSSTGNFFWRVSKGRIKSSIGKFKVNDLLVMNSSEMLSMNRRQLAGSPRQPTLNGNYQSQTNSRPFRTIASEVLKSVFQDEKKSNFWMSADYQLSSLKAIDSQVSIYTTLKSNSYITTRVGYNKELLPSWQLRSHLEFSLLDRDPPNQITIENSVKNLMGAQVGFYKILADLDFGLFVKINEMELVKNLTSTVFEMEKELFVNLGITGKMEAFQWSKISTSIGASFLSSFHTNAQSHRAYTREVFLNTRLPESSLFPTTSIDLFWQDISIVSRQKSQYSDAVGLRFQFGF